MPVILIDVHLDGHAARIWQRLQAPAWRELTLSLEVAFLSFHEANLDQRSPDDLVWHFCQERGYYLLTSNRNEDAPNSLEATIRREGRLQSLPVFTLPFPDRVFHDSAFLDRVVDKLLDFIMFSDNIRGAERLFLP